LGGDYKELYSLRRLKGFPSSNFHYLGGERSKSKMAAGRKKEYSFHLSFFDSGWGKVKFLHTLRVGGETERKDLKNFFGKGGRFQNTF